MRRTVLAAALGLLAACAAPRRAAWSSPLVGRSLDVAVEDLSGREVRLSADPGRVRLVDLWATWCEPCRAQMPALDKLAKTYGEQGLLVQGVAFDEDRAQVESFLKETPVSFDVLWDKGGERVISRLEVARLPTTLFVDRRGVIRAVHLGFRSDELDAIEQVLRSLLAEPAPSALPGPPAH